MMTNRYDPTPGPSPEGRGVHSAGHWVGVFALVLLSLFSVGDVAAQTPLVTKDARVKVQQGNNTLLTPVSQLFTGRVGATYNVAAYGIYPNGMDCRAPLQALLDTMYNNGGGTLEFNSGTYRVSGRLKPKWTTACVGKSVPLKVTGTGAFMQGQLSLGVQAGGTILRYVGSDSILWDLRGVGLTEFTGLTMMDTTHGMTIFIRSTLNTVHVHDCSFFGDKSQYSADDIGIVLGSYKRGTIDGLCADGDTTINSGFQGYGTVIRDNFFNGISYGVWGRHNANGIHILNNTWWNNCGGWAAVRFGTNGNYNLSASNLISGNLIESSWYQNGIALYNSSKAIICENQFYDHTDTCDYDIYLDQYSTFCYVEAQFCNTDTSKILRDVSGTATSFITEQNYNSKFTQGLKVYKTLEYHDPSTMSMTNVTSSGKKMYQIYESSGVSQYVENSPPTAVKLFNVRDGGSNTRILELSGSSANYFDSPGDMRFRATGDEMYFSTNSNNNHGIVDGTFYAGLASTVNVMRMGQGDRVSWSSGSGPTNSESVGLTSTVAGTLRTVDASAADAPHQARDFQATGTSANQLPAGTTAQAPTPSNGQMRYDTDLGKLRAVVGGSWRSVQTDADALSGSGSNTQMTYWTGSNTLSGSNNLLYASSILQVKNSSTTTSFGATTANENIRLQNTDATPTNNNYSGISSYTQGGSIDAGIGFKHINHSTGESSIELFSRNSSGSFQRLASFANPTITFDKTVTMTLATTFSAGFTSNTTGPTFNAGFTVNTVAPTFNTALTLGSSSVGSKLTVWNDYSSTSPAQSTAFDAIHIQNRNSTNNNWASLSFYAQGGLLAGNVAAQYTDHTSGYANISIYTRGATGSYGPVATFTANKVTQFASHTEVRSGSDLRIYDSDNTNYVAFKTPATGTLTADRTYTLPADYGSNGYQLTTDGSGGLTWTAAGGGGGGTNYQTFRDDGSDMTQRAAANFVSTSTVTAALTDDSGNGETEIALSVPTDGITATQIAADAVGTSEIATDGVGAAEIAAGAVGTSEIADGSIAAGDLDDMGAASGDVLTYNGSAWAPAAVVVSETNAPPTLRPSTITATTDDYSPTGYSTTKSQYIEQAGDGSFRAITGLAAATRDGVRKTFANTGSNCYIIAKQHTNSSAANRFNISQDVVMVPGMEATFRYDSVGARWRLVSATKVEYLNMAEYALLSNSGTTTLGDNETWNWTTNGGTNASVSASSTSNLRQFTMTTGAAAGNSPVTTTKTQVAYLDDNVTYIRLSAKVRTGTTLSDAAQDYDIRLGFKNGTDTTIAEGMYISYQREENSGGWTLKTSDGSVTSYDNAGSPLATSTWYTLELIYYPYGEVVAFIDGTRYAKTTNLPTLVAGQPILILDKDNGSTSRFINYRSMVFQAYSVSDGTN